MVAIRQILLHEESANGANFDVCEAVYAQQQVTEAALGIAGLRLRRSFVVQRLRATPGARDADDEHASLSAWAVQGSNGPRLSREPIEDKPRHNAILWLCSFNACTL